MKTYTKFLVNGFIKSFLNVFLIMISLVFILNILKEVEFFSTKEVNSFFPIYLSIMNSPSIIFEMFPFIFLIATQFFFLKLFNNNEINIFEFLRPVYLNISISLLSNNFIKNNCVQIKKIKGNISKIIEGVFNVVRNIGK